MLKITQFKKHYKKYFPTGEGWRLLIEKLVDDIIKIDKKVVVSQVKEKFGTLRFYIYGGDDEVYKLINKAERKSETICETCGKKGKTRGKGWLVTLCLPCWIKHKKERL